MTKLEFVFFDAGGGHRAAATAVDMAIRDQKRPWEVRLTNLQELLDSIDILRKFLGIRIQDTYNIMLRRGWTLGSAQLMRALQLAIRAYHRLTVRMLVAHWKETQPDIVVSFIPHFNRALFQSYRRVFPDRPFVTVLTDIADYPPHFWIERQPQYFICGSDRAVSQARALGHTPDHIFQASGMILHPRFYAPQTADPGRERERLSLRRNLPTALVLFGGYGNRVMLEIAQHLDRSALDMQLVMICGKNASLAKSLRQRKTRLRTYVEGFTSEIPYYMNLCDFFIGKPGPGSISEALKMHLPTIVDCNAWTLPQERYNAQWIREKEVGFVLTHFRHIVPAVTELLEPKTLARCRENAARMHNRAVFEIPEFIDRILQSESAGLAKPSALQSVSLQSSSELL